MFKNLFYGSAFVASLAVVIWVSMNWDLTRTIADICVGPN